MEKQSATTSQVDYLQRLPTDVLRHHLLPYFSHEKACIPDWHGPSDNPVSAAQNIFSLAATCKKFKMLLNEPALMRALLESVRYDAHARTIHEWLKEKPFTLPVMQDKKIISLITEKEKGLVDGIELIENIEAANMQEVVGLLGNKKIDLNSLHRGVRPLFSAIRGGHENIVTMLIVAGADIELPDHEGDAAIFRAITFEDSTILNLLLKAGVNPDSKDSNGQTPLIYAITIKYRCTIPVSLLLKAGANPNAKNIHGEYALMLAADKGNVEIMQQLLNAGALLDAQDVNGKTVRERIDKFLNENGSLVLYYLDTARKQQETNQERKLITYPKRPAGYSRGYPHPSLRYH